MPESMNAFMYVPMCQCTYEDHADVCNYISESNMTDYINW